MAYRDFTLRIGATGSGYSARVLESPSGERAECAFELPFAPGELADLAGGLGRAVRAVGASKRRHLRPFGGGGPLAAPDLGEVGRQLSEALFRGPVRDRFLESLGGHRRLRVRLRFDLAQAGGGLVHRVPWEVLLSPVTGRPLALSRHTPLVRFLEVARGVGPPPAPETIEVLLVAAQPAGTERLDLEAEERSLRAALGATPVTVRRVSRPTLGGIVEALQTSQVHGLHVMGHADVDPETGEGVLLLEDENGRADPVTARRFVTLVADFLPSLRLVFLNACRTAEASERAPLAGFAPALVEEGLPAVIAMQWPVSDGAAALFAGTVYRRLAAGAPIDEAVTEGRLALWNAQGRTLPDLPEWATPTLFLRVPDGRLFVPGEAEEAADLESPGGRRGRGWAAGLAAAGALTVAIVGITSWTGGNSPADSPGSSPTPVAAASLADAQVDAPAGGEPESAQDDAARRSRRGFDGGRAARQAFLLEMPPKRSERALADPWVGEAEAPERELADGASARVSEVAASVTVDFLELDGEAFIRVSVLRDGGVVESKPAYGPETLDFGRGDDALAVHVVHVDWLARTVRLRVTRSTGR